MRKYITEEKSIEENKKSLRERIEKIDSATEKLDRLLKVYSSEDWVEISSDIQKKIDSIDHRLMGPELEKLTEREVFSLLVERRSLLPLILKTSEIKEMLEKLRIDKNECLVKLENVGEY